jgi:pimeloyl-ACP methyl ester carboxylesterase
VVSAESAFVLVHSPFVGPTSWLPVAQELERRGRAAVAPALLGVAEAPEPQWRHVADAAGIVASHVQQRIVLVGHGAAGLLLPVIADALDNEVAALVFVDSFLPPSAGRLPLGPPEFMVRLRAIATDGVLPPWSRWFGADAMRELVPDERLRALIWDGHELADALSAGDVTIDGDRRAVRPLPRAFPHRASRRPPRRRRRRPRSRRARPRSVGVRVVLDSLSGVVRRLPSVARRGPARVSGG